MVKADEAQRETFVAEYAALREEAQRSGAKVFFADEAHFRADAELRGKWVLQGEPALVASSSPSYGERASYYSAVCLETGEVEWMALEGNSNSETAAAFLEQLRERHGGWLNVIWDNAPARDWSKIWRGGAGSSESSRIEPEAGEPAGLPPGLQRRRGHLGLGQRGSHAQSVPAQQGGGAGAGRQILGRAGRTERGGQAPLPDGSAIKGRSASASLSTRFPASRKCTSHLGFGLVCHREERSDGAISFPCPGLLP